MSTKLTYTGAEVQELLDKIEKGDFDNAKTLEGHPASYFAIASEFTSLAESFATEQGRVSTLYSYFNNGSANDALSLGGQLPSYYATATQYEILQQTLTDFKSLFDSMFEKDSAGNIHAKLSLWSSGGITAGEVGSGGSGGGGISYNRLDSWSDYSAEKAGYVLSALLGKDLDNRVSALANAGYVTQSALAPYALRSEIPSLEPYFLTSNFTKSNIKATLGISDWALASAKPTYTASEVGALGVKDTAQQSYGLRHSTTPISDKGLHWWSGQFQVSTEPVSGKIYLGSSGDYTVISVPGIDGTSSLANACVLRLGYNRQFFHEIFTSPNSHNIYHRNVHVGNGNPWRQFAFTSDLPTKLSQLTDDVVAGKYLSLAGGTVNGSITASSFIGNLTGNADSATKLATPRTIWGQSFDGTGNISGNLSSGAWRIITDNSTQGVFVQAKLVDSTSDAGRVFITGYSGGRLSLFNVWSDTTRIKGNVGINIDYPSEALHVNGNGKFTGALLSQALRSAGISIGCDASGVASDNYAREINTFANKLYLQYRGGDLDLCGGGGTTYIGGVLDGKTAKFTSLTSPAITTNTLKVGNVTLVEENGALKVIGRFIATGGVTSGEKAS